MIDLIDEASLWIGRSIGQKPIGNLKVAQFALDAGESDAAVSRAYYGVFQAELAALLKLTDYRRKGKH